MNATVMAIILVLIVVATVVTKKVESVSSFV